MVDTADAAGNFVKLIDVLRFCIRQDEEDFDASASVLQEEFTTTVRFIPDFAKNDGDVQSFRLTHSVNNTVAEFLELVKDRLFPKDKFANRTLVAVFESLMVRF